MRIALVEPYIASASLRAFAEKTEPAHLLGMYDLIAAHGVDVTIIDAHSRAIPAEALARTLRDGGFTHVGFTAYDYDPCLTYLGQVVASLDSSVVTILGGPGPTYTPERMAAIVGADWIVRGDGEAAIDVLLRASFAPADLSVSQYGSAHVIESPPSDLDTTSFVRPYSLDFYDHEASPRVQRGCRGKCVFCLGAYQRRFAYMSASRFGELLQHLISEKQARVLSPLGPDFTAIPARANELVETLVRSGLKLSLFRPGVRLDTLHAAVILNSGLWHELSAYTTVHFESSIESFAYSRLSRLGKNVKADFMVRVIEQIASIIEVCRSKFVLGRIAIDPTVTIDEFIEDTRGWIQLLTLLVDSVTIGGTIMNRFVPLWGTPSMQPPASALWSQPEQISDPAVRELISSLLDHPKFRRWCRLAEQITDFAERNLVLTEILRVTLGRAEEVRQIQQARSVSFSALAAS